MYVVELFNGISGKPVGEPIAKRETIEAALRYATHTVMKTGVATICVHPDGMPIQLFHPDRAGACIQIRKED